MAEIVAATLGDSARARVQGSTRLLSEWLALFRRGNQAFHQLRLGVTEQRTFGVPLDSALERMLRRFNRYADAVVVTPEALEVIEAKVVADPSAISQVKLYAKLASSTPELSAFSSLPIVPMVVFGTFDQAVSNECSQAGVMCITHSPGWIGEYLNERYFRSRATRKRVV